VLKEALPVGKVHFQESVPGSGKRFFGKKRASQSQPEASRRPAGGQPGASRRPAGGQPAASQGPARVSFWPAVAQLLSQKNMVFLTQSMVFLSQKNHVFLTHTIAGSRKPDFTPPL